MFIVDLIDILLILLGIILGVVIGYFIVKSILTKQQQEARSSADHIIGEAEKEANSIKKEKLLRSKENQISKMPWNEVDIQRNDLRAFNQTASTRRDA